MHITLIGMSNIGKSRWAQKLATEGYEPIACDTLIEHRLAPQLASQGYAGIDDVAKWMGQPFDAQYPATSADYLAAERDVMREAIARLEAKSGAPFIIDTTGSVIYMGGDIAGKLRALSRIVYLEASPAHVTQLFERYLGNPKPVIWNGVYAPQPGEAPQEALKRCYPKLLQSRASLYAQLAHVTIPYEKHRAAGADILSLISAG